LKNPATNGGEYSVQYTVRSPPEADRYAKL